MMNQRIIGLDYGSKTVGVAVSDPLGFTAQGLETITRKDENKLRKTYARIEALIREYEAEKIVLGYPKNMNDTEGERVQKTLAFKEAIALRREGLKVEFDFLGRSMKAQMKQANRLAAKYVLILGEDEVARGCAVLRNMSTSEQTEIPIQDITSILKTEVQSHE